MFERETTREINWGVIIIKYGLHTHVASRDRLDDQFPPPLQSEHGHGTDHGETGGIQAQAVGSVSEGGCTDSSAGGSSGGGGGRSSDGA